MHKDEVDGDPVQQATVLQRFERKRIVHRSDSRQFLPEALSGEQKLKIEHYVR